MKERTSIEEPEVRMFFSYAHADPPIYRSRLESLLRWPQVQALTKWSDSNIVIGSQPDLEIRAELGRMDIFVALITPYFAASRYITEVEVAIAQHRHKKEKLKVVPIVIHHPGEGDCKWLLSLEWLPDTKHQQSWAEMQQSIGKLCEYDTTLTIIRNGIKKVVDQVLAEKKARIEATTNKQFDT